MRQYLSEAFLEVIGLDFSEESILKGIPVCQKMLDERLQKIKSPLGHVLYFLDSGDLYGWPGNRHWQELRDFWDVAKDFECEKYAAYEITRVAKSIYTYGKKAGLEAQKLGRTTGGDLPESSGDTVCEELQAEK